MSKTETLDDALLQQLIATTTETLTQTCALPTPHAESAAIAVLEHLREQLAATRLYIPAQSKLDAAAIESDWRRGLNVREITARHGCHRSTAYDYHPSRRKTPGK